MAVTTLALIAAAIGVGLPHRPRYRASETGLLLRNMTLAVVTPVLALPIALGTTDPPVIALMCLALACASRSAEVRPGPGGRPAQGPAPGARQRAGSPGTGSRPLPSVPRAR